MLGKAGNGSNFGSKASCNSRRHGNMALKYMIKVKLSLCSEHHAMKAY
jgi:hypothetical protein